MFLSSDFQGSMSYATALQFVSSVTLIEAKALASLQGAPGYDAVLIDDKLEAASATIDTYLAGRYATPLTVPPLAIVQAAIDLAREALDRQGRDHVKLAADRARQWLKDLSKGVATLGIAAGAEDAPEVVADGGPQYVGPDRVFTDDTLAAYLRGS